MKKQLYTVNVHYDAMVTVDVEAENEKEALDLAEKKANGMEFDRVEPASACIVAVNNIVVKVSKQKLADLWGVDVKSLEFVD